MLQASAALLLVDRQAAPADAAVRAVPSSASIQSDGRGVENAAWVAGQASGTLDIQTARRATGGRWSRLATLVRQRSVGGRPGIWGLRTDASGTATLFWTLATPQGTGDQLYLARRPVGGAWGRPEVAPLEMPATQRMTAADTTVGVAADGTTTAVWCAYVSGAATAAGSGAGLLSRTQTSAGVWGPVTRVFADETEYCNSPRLAVSQSGDIAVTWWGARFQGFGFRPAGGAWAPPVPIAASGRPVFGPDGRIHVIGGSGNTPAHTVFDRTGRLEASSLMPEPLARETFSGRRGGGQLASMTMGFTKARQPVLIWNRLGSTNPLFKQKPAAGIWTAMRVGGRWVVRPIDALGTVEAQGGFDLASDVHGAVNATWYGQSIGRGCKLRTPVYRARLTPKGSWAGRVLIGYRTPVGSGDCEPAKAWTPELNAYPQTFKKPKAALRLALAVRTRTTAAIIRAKGITLTCRVKAAGNCAAGVTGVSPAAAWSLFDAKCLGMGARATTTRAGAARVLRLKLKSTCRGRLRSVVKGSRPVVVTVSVAADVIGRRSGLRQVKIRLTR